MRAPLSIPFGTDPKRESKARHKSVCAPASARLDLVDLDDEGDMETVNICGAKARLSQLVDKAAAGEDVVLSRNGESLVRITQLRVPKRRIQFGVLNGKVRIAADLDAPLPDDGL